LTFIHATRCYRDFPNTKSYSLAASWPVLPAKASAVSVFQHFLCRFSGNIPHSEFLLSNSQFLLSPCSVRLAPRSTPHPVTPSASSMRSPLRVQSSHRLNSLTSLMLQFSLSLVRCPWSVVLSQNS